MRFRGLDSGSISPPEHQTRPDCASPKLRGFPYFSKPPRCDMSSPVTSAERIIAGRLLLGCGIAAPLIYVAADITGALSYPGYHYAAQAISEMTAIGAPTADLLAPFYTAFSLLFAAFAVGVWLAAGGRRSLRWSAGFKIALAGLAIGWALFPMNVRGAEPTFTDAMHLMLGAGSVFLLTGAIASGASAFGPAFRIYSGLSILVMLVFGYLTTLDVPNVAAGLPTPYPGVNERLSMASWLLWIGMLAVQLMKFPRRTAIRCHAGP